MRILLFELRYFGGDIGILSPHLQLTASGPNKLRKKRKFAYYANKNDSSHHVTKSKIIVNENISQNLKIKSGAFPRHQDQWNIAYFVNTSVQENQMLTKRQFIMREESAEKIYDGDDWKNYDTQSDEKQLYESTFWYNNYIELWSEWQKH